MADQAAPISVHFAAGESSGPVSVQTSQSSNGLKIPAQGDRKLPRDSASGSAPPPRSPAHEQKANDRREGSNGALVHPHHRTHLPKSKEEKALLRKIDIHMFPCLCLLYMLNHLDRASISNARVGGMELDLRLSSTDYSTVVLIFFVGYLSAEIPSNMLLSHLRPSLFLPALTFIWGAVVTLISLVKNKEGLIVARLFLGFVESGFFPGVLLLLSSWYRKAELAKRIGVLYSGGILAGAFGGLISGGVIDGLEGVGGIRGWRWLFIIEGLITVSASVVVVFFLPDWPSNTKWLTEEEKKLAVSRLEIDQIEQGAGSSANSTVLSHRQALAAAGKDWRTYLFCFMYIMILSSQTILYFIPSIVVSLGYHGQEAQFMTVPPYVVAWAFALGVSFSADYFEERMFHVAIPVGFSGLLYGLCLGITDHKSRYALVCLAFGATFGSLPVVLAWVSNVAGFQKQKRAITLAIVNTVGNSSNFYGSFLWPKSQAPHFGLGFAMATAFGFACAISAFLGQFLLTKFPREITVIPEKSIPAQKDSSAALEIRDAQI
ncbi:hypothetical protein Pst134EB_005720 [Puccinia striiformis f. sp. tritici]|uniref:Major facilitator superfamily (MFS) profile domain-containing protein n=2 Tax=Puccinia striiformis TaxID=27350 RepID=A0A0L0VTQ5_9BASI|nr:hypothetical protein Pst134EB_005720 [Puccinia striiformis f. sp. tritici]KNF02651.1 hypothetical protein PSTG_04248 [Puccinia striiformis f. sp. tritici PST-78]POV98844.1 hypothetical protein PSTT_14151 [Puccinia striiformis]